MRVAIIGGGTYGSYAAATIAEICAGAEIHIFEVGAESCQSESEVGYLSQGEGNYQALARGRYFGLGGTSMRWGGQILTFSRSEFKNPTPFLSDLIDLNERYQSQVAKRLGIPIARPEVEVGEGVYSKEGVWLGYNRRNLFKTLKIAGQPNVQVHVRRRIVGLEHRSGAITALTYLENTERKSETFDFYVLASGAFESNRLLMVSDLMEPKITFSDHLSRRAFALSGPRNMGSIDFEFRFASGGMLTRRLVGEIDDVSYFAHPIFNADFRFFQDLKGLLYKRELSRVTGLIGNFPAGVRFAYEAFVRRRLHVHGPWFLQIDLEAPADAGRAELSDEVDRDGQRGLHFSFATTDQMDRIYDKAVAVVGTILEREGAQLQSVQQVADGGKYEDTFHPFGMFGSTSRSLQDFYDTFSNMLVVNTGILPRAGSINCTAAVFPVIEDYVRSRLAEQVK